MKTTPLGTRRDRLRFWLRQYDPWMLAGLLVVALILGGAAIRYLISTWQQRATIIVITPTPSLPTPAAPQLGALTSSTIQRTARAIIAYDDSGQLIGAIEIGRPYTPTAQIDDTWLLADMQGSGMVRLKIAELYGLAGLPRIVQPTAPPPITPSVILVEQAPKLTTEDAPATEPPPDPPTPRPTPSPTLASDFAASFQDPPKPNPFIGCVTNDCRKQFGQPTTTAP